MLAYVLINLRDKNERKVLEELESYNEVEECYAIFGEWDLILKLNISSPEALSAFIIEHIRTHPEIKLTSTLIVAEFAKKDVRIQNED